MPTVELRSQYGRGLARNIRNLVFRRRLTDGFQLSDRVWNFAKVAEREILEEVNAAISTGTSAVDIAKQVRNALLTEGPAWTTGIKRSITGKGTIAYNALRLARTETNQAYHMGQRLQAKTSPLVIGMKWNLSGSHPTDWPPSAAYMGYPEICDYYADHDHAGLGPGVFPKDDVPVSHPNCLCFLTDVFTPPEHLEQSIEIHENLDFDLL